MPATKNQKIKTCPSCGGKLDTPTVMRSRTTKKIVCSRCRSNKGGEIAYGRCQVCLGFVRVSQDRGKQYFCRKHPDEQGLALDVYTGRPPADVYPERRTEPRDA